MPYIAHEIGHLFICLNPYDNDFFSKLTWYYELIGFTKPRLSLNQAEEIVEKYLGGEVKNILGDFIAIYTKMFNDLSLNIVDILCLLREIYCDIYATLIAGPSYPLTLISAYPHPSGEYSDISIQTFLRLYACAKVCENIGYEGRNGKTLAENIIEYLEKKFNKEIIEKIDLNKDNYSKIINDIIQQLRSKVIKSLKIFTRDKWRESLRDAENIIDGRDFMRSLTRRDAIYVLNVIWAIRLKNGEKYRLSYYSPRHSFHVINILCGDLHE